VLPAAARVRRSEDFKAVLRRGRRVARGPIVVHLLPATVTDPTASPRAGFVVGRGVGNAVTRNLVRRRLRHLVRDRLAALPAGATLVVRALPGASDVSFRELSGLLDRALTRLTGAAA
jgi:ribonuclease P protein component